MKNIRIAFFDAKEYDKSSFNTANESFGYEVDYYDTRLSESTVRLAQGHNVVCAFVNDRINKAVIDELVKLDVKVIAMRCAGFNNIDLEYAKDRISIVRVPAYSPYAVAEHTMALLLTSVRRIHKAYIRTKNFNFRINGFTGFDLHGKTVGVVGTGKIGKIFIDICKGFGMNIIAYDKYPIENSDINYVELDDIWKLSDIISFHCPLTNDNEHIVNEKSISKMKAGVIILNTSRGALIDSEALLNGIKQRKIGAACLDVYEDESSVFFHDLSDHIIEDDILSRLISMPNVIVTSHQAYLTNEALKNIADTTLNNIKSYYDGKIINEICY